MPLRILVTGADGFVGRALCPVLTSAGHHVRRVVRTLDGSDSSTEGAIAVGDIGLACDWRPALGGIDVVVHLAGRAHVMREAHALDPATAYRQTNVVGTEQLAMAAVAAGVHRLVFVSSVKVNGESTHGVPYRETDPPRPEDDYGRSKWNAEQRLTAIAAGTGLQTVIVRPPLIYGPGVKGNIARLVRTVEHGIPLPLACVGNRRSLIGLGNLITALIACVEHPAAAGETFLVSDGSDLSTPALIRVFARALGRPARLFPVPVPVLRLGAALTRSGAMKRLLGSLVVDCTHIRTRLGWIPSRTMDEEVADMVRALRAGTGPGHAHPL